jgi:hypothetical protein
MLYREIIAVCSEIHTKHINILCGQNVELLNVKVVVHIVAIGLRRANLFESKVTTCLTKTMWVATLLPFSQGTGMMYASIFLRRNMQLVLREYSLQCNIAVKHKFSLSLVLSL